eukprot:scaffold549_cov385-Prasinococcus_capsulatus_cf.AAC.38
MLDYPAVLHPAQGADRRCALLHHVDGGEYSHGNAERLQHRLAGRLQTPSKGCANKERAAVGRAAWSQTVRGIHCVHFRLHVVRRATRWPARWVRSGTTRR